MIDVEVKGIEELERRMKELATTGITKAASKGMRAALKIIEKAEIAAAPVGPSGRKNKKGEPITPGGLKRSIGSRFAKGKAQGFVTAKAGLNVKARNSKEGLRAFHAHLVALGTQPRWAGVKYGYNRKRGKPSQYNPKADRLTGKKLRYTGIMPANSFIKTATESAQAEAVSAMRKVTLEVIEAEARKT